MTPSADLPAELVELVAGADPARARTLPVPLPPGRVVTGNADGGGRPALWVSDQPPTTRQWPALRAAHPRSGLWPLLLYPLGSDDRRPWQDGELWTGAMSSPDDHDPGDLLAAWWAENTEVEDEDESPRDEQLAVTAPYGRQWPGLAAPTRSRTDPDAHADRCAQDLLRPTPWVRLGLVPADRGSDALAVAGWYGAANYTEDAGELAAVLRSWEDRFGARVIGVGFAELRVSVAAPPTDHARALRVAAEHFAFCPDNIWQGPGSLDSYARLLIDAPLWRFWWD